VDDECREQDLACFVVLARRNKVEKVAGPAVLAGCDGGNIPGSFSPPVGARPAPGGEAETIQGS
jgi:hypothetical protein